MKSRSLVLTDVLYFIIQVFCSYDTPFFLFSDDTDADLVILSFFIAATINTGPHHHVKVIATMGN